MRRGGTPDRLTQWTEPIRGGGNKNEKNEKRDTRKT